MSINKMKKLIIGLLTTSLLLTTACSGGGKTGIGTNSPNQTAKYGDTYPIETDETLTYWIALHANLATITQNLGDIPFGQEIQKRSGIKVEFLHPVSGQQREQFNLMLASGELPDIVVYNWYNFPGGPEKALKDYILNLNSIIDQYSPNLKTYLQNHPDIDTAVKTDDGNYYVFPFIRGDEKLAVYNGPLVRKDWLDELGIDEPEIIDEWTQMLKAFKAEKNAEAPLSFDFKQTLINGSFIGAYGVAYGFYVKDGQVKYGPTEQGSKDFLTTFYRWYEEGLLDRNFGNVDGKILDANILNGKTGASVGSAGGGLGKWMTAAKDINPNFNLTGVKYPVLRKGERAMFGQKDFLYTSPGSAAITKNCKNPELAARFLDFAFSDEGHLIYNFGIEGVSYEMIDGYPTYTDEILNAPDGVSIANALPKYTMVNYSGPFLQDIRYIEQYYELPQQLDAITKWMETDQEKYRLPQINIGEKDSNELAKALNEINTYVDEMYLKFIYGVESLDGFDKFSEQVNHLGLEKVLSTYQEALDRFYQR